MSRVSWSRCLLPPADAPVEDRVYGIYDPPLVVARTRAFPAATQDLVALPDRRAYRSLARTGVLLCAAGLAAAEALAPYLAADRYRVGIYCATDPGPQNYECARELAGRGRDEFAAVYKQLNHPKRYLTQLANLPAAHLGIFLGVRGPVNVYCHSGAAALHALEQAELDLEGGAVTAALVCSAFSLEDPLLSLRVRTSRPDGAIIQEGAAAVVLTAGGDAGNVSAARNGGRWRPRPGAGFSGLAQPLIDFAQEENLSC